MALSKYLRSCTPLILGPFANFLPAILLQFRLTQLIFAASLHDLMKRLKYIFNNHGDLLGFAGSTLCALHCSALPLLLAMGMLSGFEWMESHWVEYAFFISALLLAGYTILRSFIKHRKPLALLVATAGFVCFLIGIFQHNHAEIGLTTLGGVLIAIAHIINWRVSNNRSKAHSQHSAIA